MFGNTNYGIMGTGTNQHQFMKQKSADAVEAPLATAKVQPQQQYNGGRHTKSACKGTMVMSPYNIKSGASSASIAAIKNATAAGKDHPSNTAQRSSRVLTMTASKAQQNGTNLINAAANGKSAAASAGVKNKFELPFLSTRSNSNKPSLVAQRAQTTAQATGYQLTHSHTFLPNKMNAGNAATANTAGVSTGSMLTNIAQQAKKQRMMYATSSVGSNVAKSVESPARHA